MRKLLAALMAVGLMLGGASVAVADPPADPGKEHGHCTAFFNGQKKGHGKKDGTYPGPFQELQDKAPDGTDDDDGDGQPTGPGETGGELSDLYDWCQQYGIGGNPDENGRFTSCWTDDDADPSTHTCDD